MKATAIAPSNIALIKYWGKRNEKLRIPSNSNISMNLSNFYTITTVEFSSQYRKDNVIINNTSNEKEVNKVIKHLNRIRKIAHLNQKAKVVSQNNFPTASGIASSASGFAALTVASAKAAGLTLSEKELSILARQGSGSACRSIPDGFVEWVTGDSNETSFAYSLYSPKYWNIVDIVAIVGFEKKEVSTTDGQQIAHTSPFYNTRLEKIDKKIHSIKQAIKEKNFTVFGKIIEQEALELHTIMLTSTPSLIYWNPATITIIKRIKQLRKKNILCYFTIDAGPHVHVICEEKNIKIITTELEKIQDIRQVVVNYPSKGSFISNQYLF
jgi:diphosphomevalonate decarboxylase